MDNSRTVENRADNYDELSVNETFYSKYLADLAFYFLRRPVCWTALNLFQFRCPPVNHRNYPRSPWNTFQTLWQIFLQRTSLFLQMAQKTRSIEASWHKVKKAENQGYSHLGCLALSRHITKAVLVYIEWVEPFMVCYQTSDQKWTNEHLGQCHKAELSHSALSPCWYWSFSSTDI